MTVKQDTLWDRFLSPLIQNLIDRDAILQLRDRIDWDRAVSGYIQPGFTYPDIQAYAARNLDAWIGKAGFDEVRTRDVFVLNQVTSGIRY